MMSKMKCFGALAGCVLATGALYATAPTYSETFEGTPDLTKWSGGTVTSSNYTYSATGTAGFPLTNPLPDPNNVLVIEGNTEYAHGSAIGSGGAPLVDMMVQTARPDDELGFPSSEPTNTIQIAVAVDSDGKFNAYCKNKSGTVGWNKLSDTVYDPTGWARVSFLFDYTVSPKRCQIRIDGQPVMSANGYLTADATDGTANGAWYTLANDVSGVSSMKVIGCTAIDEVVLDSMSTSYALAGGSDASGVPYSWYDAYGIAWTPAASYDNSGMSVAAKHDACLSPFDDQVFSVKSMSVAEANGTATVTVGIPEFVATPGRKVVIDYGTDKTFTTKTTQDVATGQSTVNITAPADAVIYYRLRATTAQ